MAGILAIKAVQVIPAGSEPVDEVQNDKHDEPKQRPGEQQADPDDETGLVGLKPEYGKGRERRPDELV